LAGSYYVEQLTDQMEEEANHYFRQIEALGGVLLAIEAGFFQSEIAEAAYRYQMEIDTHERIIVGVNGYLVDEPTAIPILAMDPTGYDRQVGRLQRLRAERDNTAVQRALVALAAGARGRANLMPAIIAAVETYATLGEICDVFREVFGVYHEPVFF